MSSRFILLAIVTVILLLVISAASAADADIVFSEIMINAVIEPVGQPDWGEWIEIYNKGATPVDLNGWEIQDNTYSDTFNLSNCPGGSCQIPAGGCWLIAVSPAGLQNEFSNYANPYQPAVEPDKTIFLGERLGNGLANDADHITLINDTGGTVDCYSWDGFACSSLSTGSGHQGQSVTNVQGDWFNHQVNGSPYNCVNVAEGGPTAVSLNQFTATTFHPNLTLLLVTAVTGCVAWLTVYRRAAKN